MLKFKGPGKKRLFLAPSSDFDDAAGAEPGRAELDELLEAAHIGIEQLIAVQRRVLGDWAARIGTKQEAKQEEGTE